jgi:hypothetical protein
MKSHPASSGISIANDAWAPLLHLNRQEAGGRGDLKNAPTAERNLTEILIEIAAQIPLAVYQPQART